MMYWKHDLVSGMANNVKPFRGAAVEPGRSRQRCHPTGSRNLAAHEHDHDRAWPAWHAGSFGRPGCVDEEDKQWGTDKIDDLWHAALNSRGLFHSAKDPKQLTGAISASLKQIAERDDLTEAGVATAAATLSSDNRKYVPSYKSGVWSGDVQAFLLDANGVAGKQLWSAASALPSWTQRKIYTWDADQAAPAAVPFEWASLGAAARKRLGPLASEDLVNYLRGDRSKEEGSTPGRAAQACLTASASRRWVTSWIRHLSWSKGWSISAMGISVAAALTIQPSLPPRRIEPVSSSWEVTTACCTASRIRIASRTRRMARKCSHMCPQRFFRSSTSSPTGPMALQVFFTRTT